MQKNYTLVAYHNTVKVRVGCLMEHTAKTCLVLFTLLIHQNKTLKISNVKKIQLWRFWVPSIFGAVFCLLSGPCFLNTTSSFSIRKEKTKEEKKRRCRHQFFNKKFAAVIRVWWCAPPPSLTYSWLMFECLKKTSTFIILLGNFLHVVRSGKTGRESQSSSSPPFHFGLFFFSLSIAATLFLSHFQSRLFPFRNLPSYLSFFHLPFPLAQPAVNESLPFFR